MPYDNSLRHQHIVTLGAMYTRAYANTVPSPLQHTRLIVDQKSIGRHLSIRTMNDSDVLIHIGNGLQ